MGLYLIGVAGLAASITLLFLGMPAVLGVGGFCAEGGPYVIETPCPPGVAVRMMLGAPGLFLFVGLMFWKRSSIGGRYVMLPLLGWPALFVSLGWNFVEFGVQPPAGGLALGWLLPGLVFVLMRAAPLLLVIGARGPDRRARPSLVADLGGRRAGPANWVLAAVVAAVLAGIAAGGGLFGAMTG